MWQNAGDGNLRRRPTDSRRPNRLGPCWTVTGRPEWQSWTPPDVEPEANATLVFTVHPVQISFSSSVWYFWVRSVRTLQTQNPSLKLLLFQSACFPRIKDTQHSDCQTAFIPISSCCRRCAENLHDEVTLLVVVQVLLLTNKLLETNLV